MTATTPDDAAGRGGARPRADRCSSPAARPWPGAPTAGWCSCGARCPASGCGPGSPTQRKGWARAARGRGGRRVARPDRAAVPDGGRGLRRVRSAARRSPRRSRRSRSPWWSTRCAGSAGSTTRRSSPARRSPPTAFRTTVRAAVVDGRAGLPPPPRPRRRDPRTRAWSPIRCSTSCSSAATSPRPREVTLRVGAGHAASAWPWSTPTADGVVRAARRAGGGHQGAEGGVGGRGSTTRSPAGAGASRPGRSSRPAPTAPRRWSTRWPGPRGERAGRGPPGRRLRAASGCSPGSLLGGRRSPTGSAGRPRRWSSSGRRRRSPTPATTSRTSTSGWSRPTSTPGARRRPTWSWPTRPGPASAGRRSTSLAATGAAVRRAGELRPGLARAATPRLLAGEGFRLERAELVDLFPQTHHVEVVSRFVR